MAAETAVWSDLKDMWLERFPELPSRVFRNWNKWYFPTACRPQVLNLCAGWAPQKGLPWTGFCFLPECDWSCSACKGPQSTDCLQCMEGHILHQGACVEECPPAFYRESDTCQSEFLWSITPNVFPCLSPENCRAELCLCLFRVWSALPSVPPSRQVQPLPSPVLPPGQSLCSQMWAEVLCRRGTAQVHRWAQRPWCRDSWQMRKELLANFYLFALYLDSVR